MIKIVKVSHESRTLSLGKAGTYGLGVENDNLYDTLYFQFDEMVDGQGSLLTSLQDANDKYIAFPLTKEEDGYSLVVTNTMLTTNQFTIQLMVTNGEVVWHSVEAKVKVKPCLEAGQGEMPTAVEIWLEEADAKLAELTAAITSASNLDATVSKSGDTATITITDKDGIEHTATISDGQQGATGETGPQGPEGPQGPAGKDGKDGVDGKDGKDGVDGKDGKDGKDGTNGQDGFSPTITSSKSGKVTTLTITDATGTSTATINDGADGTTPDMSNYVQKTDYATANTGGVILVSSNFASINNGVLYASIKSYADYTSSQDGLFVGKGTLENVLTGKDFATKAYVDSKISDALGGSY